MDDSFTDLSVILIVSSVKKNNRVGKITLPNSHFDTDHTIFNCIRMGSSFFKLDLVMMSIVILCLVSALLYQAVAMLEKQYGKR